MHLNGDSHPLIWQDPPTFFKCYPSPPLPLSITPSTITLPSYIPSIHTILYPTQPNVSPTSSPPSTSPLSSSPPQVIYPPTVPSSLPSTPSSQKHKYMHTTARVYCFLS